MNASTISGRAPLDESLSERFSDDLIRQRIQDFDRWFVNTDFGNGIVARSTCWPDEPAFSRHAGVGKFEFIIRRNLPDLQGKRVLEIGCNAGVISIHMARLGAEVVGIDCERAWPRWKEQAELVKSVAEWRCQTRYRIQYLECDMRELPNQDLGRFDAVLALNCIYYVDEAQIRRLCQHISTITNRFVVQCNTRDHRTLGRRPQPEFIETCLRDSGFSKVTIDWPWDTPRRRVLPQRYSRPVVVAQR